MTEAWIGIGSNLGSCRETIEAAIVRVGELGGVRWTRLSSLRETVPVGGPPQGFYLNAVGALATELEPRSLLLALQGVEVALGRLREERWGPRTIDLDILFCGERVIDEPDLVVPHPRIAERGFVLEPLAEIAGDLRHPVSGRTMSEMWAALDEQPARIVGSLEVPGPRSGRQE